jgi:hypothetical protein
MWICLSVGLVENNAGCHVASDGRGRMCDSSSRGSCWPDGGRSAKHMLRGASRRLRPLGIFCVSRKEDIQKLEFLIGILNKPFSGSRTYACSSGKEVYNLCSSVIPGVSELLKVYLQDSRYLKCKGN